jgi:hypothetical protein
MKCASIWIGRPWLWLALAATGLCFTAAPVRAQPDASREYQLKAIFLLNFLNFADWPPSAFPSADAPLRIGVLGEDPFGPALDEAVRGESVRQRPVVTQRGSRPEQLLGCHIVFVSASERPRLSRILAAFDGHPILTVSDLPDFVRRGGVIGFFTDGNKLRFEINPAAAQQRQIQLRAQLLSLARIVE